MPLIERECPACGCTFYTTPAEGVYFMCPECGEQGGKVMETVDRLHVAVMEPYEEKQKEHYIVSLVLVGIVVFLLALEVGLFMVLARGAGS